MAEVASYLTVKDVQYELQEINEWYLLGIQLGVDTSKLEQFQANHPRDAERCKVDVVQHWLNNVGSPSWKSLADAVQKLGGHTRLVQTLQGKAASDLQESSLEASVSSNGTLNGEIAESSIPVCITNGHCNGDSENVYTVCRSKHPLQGGTLDEFDESDLKVETQKVILKFGALVTNVKLVLKRQGVTVEAFASHLLTIKVLKPVYVQSQTSLLEACIKEVRAQTSIFAAIDVISDYFSWFNHMLIENIIETFCKHDKDIKERLKEFREQFQEYCKHRICKCPRNGFGGSRRKDAAILVVKVDAKWETAQVDQIAFIRDTISTILHVKRQALYLRTVDNGCIQLAFLLPEFVANAILPLAVNPREQAAALSRAGIQELHCGNLSFYFYTSTERSTSGDHHQAEEDETSSLTASDLSIAYSDSSAINQEKTTDFHKPTDTNALDYVGQQQKAPVQAVPLHRGTTTDTSNGANTDHSECLQCSSRVTMEKGLTQTLSDALCKIDALHLERDNLAVELTTLQQGIEHERKLVRRRLFGNEKVNYGLSATLQRIDNLQQERESLAIKLDVLHHRMLEKQQNTEYERKIIQNKLFGLESSDQTLSEILHRVDVLIHERHSLAAEIETLQHSSGTLLERLQGIKHERKLLHKKLFGESWGQESADQTLGNTLHKIDALHQEMDTVRQESSIHSEKLKTMQHELEKNETLRQAKDSLTMEVHTLQQNSRQLLGQLQCFESEKKEICMLLFGRENVDKSMADILREINALQQERNGLYATIDSLQQSTQIEQQKIHERLFGKPHQQEDAESRLSNVLRKIDTLHQEKDNLAMEVDKLQQSSHELHEELNGVEHLRQEVNRMVFGQESTHMTLSGAVQKITEERDDLAMEMNTLQGLKQEVIALSSRLRQTEQEQGYLCDENAQLKQQIVQRKMAESNLVNEHTKNLERANDLWKKKWPLWSETWEEQSVCIPLGTNELAGFSVVGGRDQPLMPNPGAFIVTTVDAGSPACGVLKVGDIIETVNGVNLTYAYHREATNAIKESTDLLNIVLHRRKDVHPIQVGVLSSINSIPHEADSTTKTEQLEYSLYITGKEKLGFCYDWSSTYTVTDVSPSGPAFQSLQRGDRIVKVNNVPIHNDKPSAVKKLMKPHNRSLRLVIERQKSISRPGELNVSLTSHEIQKPHRVSVPCKWSEEGPVSTHQLHSFQRSHDSNSDRDETDTAQLLQYSSQQGSKSSEKSDSVPSQTRTAYAQDTHRHSMSDRLADSRYDRRSEYTDALSTESQFSQSQSGYYSSNGSINLTFHNSPVSYNSLTVDSVATQSQLAQSPLTDSKRFSHYPALQIHDDIPSNPDSGVDSSLSPGGSLGTQL